MWSPPPRGAFLQPQKTLPSYCWWKCLSKMKAVRCHLERKKANPKEKRENAKSFPACISPLFAFPQPPPPPPTPPQASRWSCAMGMFDVTTTASSTRRVCHPFGPSVVVRPINDQRSPADAWGFRENTRGELLGPLVRPVFSQCRAAEVINLSAPQYVSRSAVYHFSAPQPAGRRVRPLGGPHLQIDGPAQPGSSAPWLAGSTHFYGKFINL